MVVWIISFRKVTQAVGKFCSSARSPKSWLLPCCWWVALRGRGVWIFQANEDWLVWVCCDICGALTLISIVQLILSVSYQNSVYAIWVLSIFETYPDPCMQSLKIRACLYVISSLQFEFLSFECFYKGHGS